MNLSTYRRLSNRGIHHIEDVQGRFNQEGMFSYESFSRQQDVQYTALRILLIPRKQ